MKTHYLLLLFPLFLLGCDKEETNFRELIEAELNHVQSSPGSTASSIQFILNTENLCQKIDCDQPIKTRNGKSLQIMQREELFMRGISDYFLIAIKGDRINIKYSIATKD